MSAAFGQSVPVPQIFTTWIETARLNGAYRQAEPIPFADPRNRAF